MTTATITDFLTIHQATSTYDLLELAVGVEGAGLDPFRSAAVALDAEFVSPSRRVIRVPGFFYGATGDDRGRDWRIRFAGDEAGDYSSQLILRVAGEEVSRLTGPKFTLATGGHGFIRRANASRYLEFDDGSAYLPVGQNVCFTSAKARQIPVWPDENAYVPMRSPDLPWDQAYARWFSRMGENGANWARLWMGAPEFDLMDGEPWQFNLAHARRLDAVFALADGHGIHLCLCLDYFRVLFHPAAAYSTGNWFSARDRAWGRLLRASEGTVDADFFTTPAVEELFHDLIRYCVARWGYSTRLFAWELWNEIGCFVDARRQADVQWVLRATRYLRQIDPWRHLVKSSCSFREERTFWGEDSGDLLDVHPYFGWGGTETAKDLARFFLEFTAEVRKEPLPFMIGETGLAREVNTAEYGLVGHLADRDRDGVALHEALWAGLFVGGCGTGMVWWWDEHTDLNDHYGQFRGISRFVQDVPWNREAFLAGVARTSDMDLRALELRGSSVRLIWLQSLHFTWWNVIHEARLSPIRNARLILDDCSPGRYELEWWDTRTGEITARDVKEVSDGTTLSLPLPEIRTDAALKVRRR